jgi:hypothetical protein
MIITFKRPRPTINDEKMSSKKLIWFLKAEQLVQPLGMMNGVAMNSRLVYGASQKHDFLLFQKIIL